ncbi:MAG: prepilin-type N-terminal cleavage/methylation domain-containing protein [Candidatus Binatia bacterium]|nr:prepilin-type N-terminal cleavage/methylation domain-containing protein [Candidatus Binatia bacterium]
MPLGLPNRQPERCRRKRRRTGISPLRLRESRGFTLLEVLVAAAISSFLLAALSGVFWRTLASKRVVEEQAARVRAAHTVLLRIGDELRGSIPTATSSLRGRTRQDDAFPQASLSFVSVVPLASTARGGAGDLQRIEYRLVPTPGEPAHYQLVRGAWLDLRADQDAADEFVPVLSHLRGLRVRFFEGRRWVEEWGGEMTSGHLPQAVEVTLYLDNLAGGEVATFSTTVTLPLAQKPSSEAS